MALRGSRNRSMERRKGVDTLTRIVALCGVAGWLTMLAMIVVLDRAKPEVTQFTPNRSMFEQAGIPYYARSTWDQDLTLYVFYLLILALVIGSIGLAVNAQRHRRQNDFYRINLVVLCLLSSGSLIYFLFF